MSFRNIKKILQFCIQYHVIKKSKLFDNDFYYSEYEDIRKIKTNSLKHFIRYGWKEGRNPSRKFNTNFYLNKNIDVKESNINPLFHYIRYGRKEGRDSVPNLKEYKSLFTQNDVVVVFDHSLGGGTNYYFNSVILNTFDSSVIVRIQFWLYSNTYSVSLFFGEKHGIVILNSDFNALKEFLFSIDPKEIILNNLVAYPNVGDVLSLIMSMKGKNKNIKVCFKGHDYYCICPSFTLIDGAGVFCGVQNNEAICKCCYDSFELKAGDIKEGFSILKWRSMWNNFLEKTVDVFEVYSESAKSVFLKAYPLLIKKIFYKPHLIKKFNRFNIGLVGNLLKQKGASVIKNCLRYLEKNGIDDFNFVLFGDNPLSISSEYFIDNGKYERSQLPVLLEKNKIDLVFISSICPETFSYSTGEVISLGYPVCCFDFGGQADQVRKYDKGIILKSDSPDYLIEVFEQIKTRKEKKNITEKKSDEKEIDFHFTAIQSTQDSLIKEYFDYLFFHRVDKSKFVKEKTENATKKYSVKPLALYLPQYHDFPENIHWFGRGFSEWTNTSQTTPQYLGHWQPHIPIDVGFYNLNNIDVMYRQVEIAKKYGIYGFGFYYYWYSGNKLMEKPIEKFLADKKLNMPFFLFWANEDWTMLWDNGEYKEVLHKHEIKKDDATKFMSDILPYMFDDRYIKINNKPLLCIYQLTNIEYAVYEKFVFKINEIAKRNGFNGLYLISPLKEDYDFENLETIQKKYYLDSLFEFYPQGLQTRIRQKNVDLINKRNKSICFDTADYISKKQYLFETKAKLMKGIFPNWDNSPRRYLQGASIFESTPENYKEWLKDIIVWTKNHHDSNESVMLKRNLD